MMPGSIDDGYVRQAIQSRELDHAVDARKFGGEWVAQEQWEDDSAFDLQCAGGFRLRRKGWRRCDQRRQELCVSPHIR